MTMNTSGLILSIISITLSAFSLGFTFAISRTSDFYIKAQIRAMFNSEFHDVDQEVNDITSEAAETTNDAIDK